MIIDLLKCFTLLSTKADVLLTEKHVTSLPHPVPQWDKVRPKLLLVERAELSEPTFESRLQYILSVRMCANDDLLSDLVC